MSVVNNITEQGVKLCSDVLTFFKNKDMFQENLYQGEQEGSDNPQKQGQFQNLTNLKTMSSICFTFNFYKIIDKYM